MTDMELAEEIEWAVKDAEQYGYRNIVVNNIQARAIIAALRRGPEPIYRECKQCGMLVACWSDAQIEAIERSAAALHAKMKPLIDADTGMPQERPPSGEITEEKIDELWKQAMTEAANHFNGFLKVGMVPNFEHPENLTLPQRFAILLLSAAEAEVHKP